MDIDTLKDAFQKLLSYSYFDKNELRQRHAIATFVKSLVNIEEENRIFGILCEVANGERQELLDTWLSKVELCFYPKKINSSVSNTDDHFVTNIPIGHAVTERLLVKSFFPVELMILDVAWLIEYGPKIEQCLCPDSYGNRMDLTLLNDKVRIGNTIFKKYNYQYKNWWENGLKEANKLLREDKCISIVNFDITNCYHSIDFNFDEFFVDFAKRNPNSDIKNSPLSNVIRQIYERYWMLVRQSYAEPFLGKNQGKHTMPLSLLSAHVLANWYISPLDDYIRKSYPKICYYGRYVDDCMIVIPSASISLNTMDYINRVLPGLIVEDGDVSVFGFARNRVDQINRLSNFCLQTDKFYVYHFNCQFPQESLERYKDDQRERSSEFRFLTDEADNENSQGLEYVTLVRSFDVQEEKSRRFDLLEENKYKLSVFFAKLNQRLAKYGNKYKYITEVEKVFKYFHGYLLIKHYVLWEKIFTAFVLAEKTDYIKDFYKRITKEINELEAANHIFSQEPNAGLLNIRRSLSLHLKESYLMAMSLHRQRKRIDSIYVDTFMVRSHFNQFPLQEFAKEYYRDGVRLPIDKLKYCRNKLKYRWMPYYVKYYDIVCALMVGRKFSPEIYKKAYGIYKTLNRKILYKDEWKVFMHKGKHKNEWEFNTSYFKLPPPESLTVSIIEMNIDESSLSRYIDSYGTIEYDKIHVMRTILDKITEVGNTNIFVMPELSLPIYELHEFCQYSSKHNKAFIAGMEYVISKDYVYNYIITCLPIILYGQNDAVPIIRLKNYYAPAEYRLIEDEKRLKIPHDNNKWRLVYHWNGHVFTNLYCFELTNIKDRAHFLSMIDAMYCPVLNKDTPYFSNIAGSCSRDLHCYLIMSNVSQYGDSRVTQPTKSCEMDIMKVKGGNTEDNKIVVLSTVLNIKELRTFQKKTLAKQCNSQTFKFTPPDFDKSYVDQRRERFLFSTKDIFGKDFWEEFIAQMYVDRMRPIL